MNLPSLNIKKMFYLGGEVTSDKTADVLLNNKELTEGVKEAKKDTVFVEKQQLKIIIFQIYGFLIHT